jgi:O-acetylhomoserine/O-acetylserine sulfhydrylase-like pyridoxal-dependent enzyme
VAVGRYHELANPTVRCLELKRADLEGAEAAVATATGMAALIPRIDTAIIHRIRYIDNLR